MTKKHFKVIADAIANSRLQDGDTLNLKEIIGLLSDIFGGIDPLFDRQRFDTACHGLPYKR